MYKKLIVVGLVVLAIVFFLYNRMHRMSHGSLPTWSSSTAASTGLSSEVILQGYGIRPPLGYDARHADTLKALDVFGINMYQWDNAADSSNASGLSVQIIRRPNLDSPSDLLKYELQLQSKDERRFVHSKPEVGNISGLTFARAYWQGMEQVPSGSYATSGFLYCTTDAMKAICITGYDRVPCTGDPCKYRPINPQALPVTEASALSFRSL